LQVKYKGSFVAVFLAFSADLQLALLHNVERCLELSVAFQPCYRVTILNVM